MPSKIRTVAKESIRGGKTKERKVEKDDFFGKELN
jgi:hypothetical protein